MSITTITPVQARRIFLSAQGLWHQGWGAGIAGTRAIIEHLGYIQIDTISVVARAHHHTLFSRHAGYEPTHLDTLLSVDKTVFEYWSHAAAYLPMRDYRYSLPRKRLYEQGKSHWGNGPKPIERIYDRIKAEGPLRSIDFDDVARKPGFWEWKESKRALEQLFMAGRLMVAERRGFHKVYDLTERVLPTGVDTTYPTEREMAAHLIRNAIGANGLASLAQIAYLRRAEAKTLIQKEIAEMLHQGTLVPIQVQGIPKETYYITPATLDAMRQLRVKHRFHILSPFDNSIIQRGRLQHWFGYEYQIECYVPAAKRKYGYFCLPLLYGDRLVGRMDAKADSATQTLIIHSLWWEDGVVVNDKLLSAFASVLTAFMHFNRCTRIDIGDKNLKKLWKGMG